MDAGRMLLVLTSWLDICSLQSVGMIPGVTQTCLSLGGEVYI